MKSLNTVINLIEIILYLLNGKNATATLNVIYLVFVFMRIRTQDKVCLLEDQKLIEHVCSFLAVHKCTAECSARKPHRAQKINIICLPEGLGSAVGMRKKEKNFREQYFRVINLNKNACSRSEGSFGLFENDHRHLSVGVKISRYQFVLLPHLNLHIEHPCN